MLDVLQRTIELAHAVDREQAFAMLVKLRELVNDVNHFCPKTGTLVLRHYGNPPDCEMPFVPPTTA
jgi:hypothetical protein